jgi:glycosyltransferase involved in cell wall biosynthesis
MKITLIINWKETGKWSFFRFLKERYPHVEVLQPFLRPSFMPFRLSSISILLSEFYLPIFALFRRRHSDVMVSWQMRIGVCYGILSRMIPQNKKPVHIIQDFHIDLTGTRKYYRFRMFLLQMAIPGIDYFCCTSTEEEMIYSRMFQIPRDRILFLPLAQALPKPKASVNRSKDYIFSFGNSDRDFDTLIRAVSVMNRPLVILSQKFQPTYHLPEHVQLLKRFIPESELTQWIAGSRVVVIPLFDYRIAAGQVSMLQAMSLGRPVVVSRNMATIEYAVHRITACFYEAGNDSDLREQIAWLWENPNHAEEMGKRAVAANHAIQDLRHRRFHQLLQHCETKIEQSPRKK